MKRAVCLLLLCGACEQRLVVGRLADAGRELADAGAADAQAERDADDDVCLSDDDCAEGDEPYCVLGDGECVECLEDVHCDGGVCDDGDCD